MSSFEGKKDNQFNFEHTELEVTKIHADIEYEVGYSLEFEKQWILEIQL